MRELADVCACLRPQGGGSPNKSLSGARADRSNDMNTQQTSDDMARPTTRPGSRRLDSILRTLTVAVALIVFGVSAPIAFADHMGNHERGEAEVAECGKTASEATGTPEITTVDPLRASIHRHGPRND
jgi:hypothetical protein